MKNHNSLDRFDPMYEIKWTGATQAAAEELGTIATSAKDGRTTPYIVNLVSSDATDDRDNAALSGIKINVVMGRDAGFLTAAAALARQYEGDGPHLIYLPERTFDVAQFQQDVKAMIAKHGRCVVAVSEGITNADGDPVMTTGERDSHGNLQLSGSGALGDFLSGKVKER